MSETACGDVLSRRCPNDASLFITISALVLTRLLSGCGGQTQSPASPERKERTGVETEFTVVTPSQTVIGDPAFGDYGRLLCA